MAENLENLDDILRDWGKKSTKNLVEALNRYEKREEETKSLLSFRKWLRKNIRAVLVGKLVLNITLR